jgi:hypothetical protein
MIYRSALVDQINEWESGGMDENEEVEFFQYLIDNGLAWTLQGCYGRRARQLIQDGLCELPQKGHGYGKPE